MKYELRYHKHYNDGEFKLRKVLEKEIEIDLTKIIPNKVISTPDRPNTECRYALEIELMSNEALSPIQEFFPKKDYIINLGIHWSNNDHLLWGINRPAICVYNKNDAEDNFICESEYEISFDEFDWITNIVNRKCKNIPVPTIKQIQQKDVAAFICEECSDKFNEALTKESEDKLIKKIMDELPALTENKYVTANWNVLTKYVNGLINSLILKYL